MLKAIGSGTNGFFKAFGFAMSNRMAWLFLVPALLWVLLSFGLYRVMTGPVDEFSLWAAQWLEIPVDTEAADWWSSIKAFLNGARELVLVVLLKFAIAYLLYITNKYIVLVLLAPLLAYASERTEEIISGKEFPFNWGQLFKDAFRGAIVALRNGLLEVSATIIIWVLTLSVPVLAPVSLVALFLISAYFYGFSMFDYLFERRRLRIGETVQAVNSRMAAVVTNGALFGLLMKVPFLGLLFAPVMAAIGAVLTEYELAGREGTGSHAAHNTQRP